MDRFWGGWYSFQFNLYETSKRVPFVPYVDLMQEHVEDYKKNKCSAANYLGQYFIGRYNPRGNFFRARGIKDEVLKMLDPKPESYR